MLLKDEVITKIENALDALGPRPDLAVRLEYAREEKFGDYACTLAMDKNWREHYAASNAELKNPRKFAEALVAQLEALNKKERFLDNVEIAGPGFINMRLAPDLLYKYLRATAEKPAEFGRSKSDNPRKIIFEFVSANPTGPLNVVSARAAALGDSCCNLLEAAGDTVHREYYVNDHGNQLDLLGRSCMYRYLESKGVPLKFATKVKQGNEDVFTYESAPGLPFPAQGYHGEYLIDLTAAVIKQNKKLAPDDKLVKKAAELAKRKDLEKDDADALEQLGLIENCERLGYPAAMHFLETQKRDLENYRVKFDEFFLESRLHKEDSVMGALEPLGQKVFKEDGKTLFRSTDYGDEKDRVIVRDDGRPTYFLADIAYHRTKIDRKFDLIYNIWGPDHHGYIKRLAGAVEAMGFNAENFRVLIAQQVNLLDGGKPVKISKRSGKMITMETLIEEIPVDVARYFFVMRAFESHLEFDLTEAMDDSSRNPYWYVAYAHARIKSIFRKAEERGLKPLGPDGDWSGAALEKHAELSPERRRLLWYIARFTEEVRDTAATLEPHRLITYLYTLASNLTKFYEDKQRNKVIDQPPETAAVLLRLLDGVAVCLKNGLGLLGMNAPDRLKWEDEDESTT